MTEEELAATIAANVARYRKMVGLTQEELAGRAYYSKNTIYEMERGRRLPALTTTLRLANVMGVPIAALFLEDCHG